MSLFIFSVSSWFSLESCAFVRIWPFLLGCPFYWCIVSYIAAAAAAKSIQSCSTPRDPIDGSPPGSPVWDSPGKNTGVGCHFLRQCMKVKSESEVAQSCPTLSDPMDCSLPGSSVHGIFQASGVPLPSPIVSYSSLYKFFVFLWCPL